MDAVMINALIGFILGLLLGFTAIIVTIIPRTKRQCEKDTRDVIEKYKILTFLFTWHLYDENDDVYLARFLAKIREDAKYEQKLSDEFITDALDRFVKEIEYKNFVKGDEL